MAYAGYLGDKSIVLQAKRNDGIHLPEHHLVNLIFPGITGIIGLMIYAVSAQHPERYTWVAPLAGWTVYQFSFISTMIITTTFAAEAFPKAPGKFTLLLGFEVLLISNLCQVLRWLLSLVRRMSLLSQPVTVLFQWFILMTI